MKKFLFCAVSIFLCLCSCSGPDNDVLDFKYHAEITEIEDSVVWSNLVDSVTYIKLETNDKCKIGEVDQLLVANEKLYVVSNGIHCFDMEGHHLFSINQRGHAKNEYVRIRNVNIVDNQLYLYDNDLAKQLIFDSNTGAYIGGTELPREVAAAYGLKDKVIIDRKDLPLEESTGDERFVISPRKDIYDTSEGYFSDNEHKFVIFGTTSVFSRGIIYSSYLNCTAWTLTDKGCEAYFRLDVPLDKKLPQNMVSQAINDKRFPMDADDYIYGLSEMAETAEFITGRLNYDTKFLYFIYDKKNGHTRCYSKVTGNETWQFIPVSFQCGDETSLFCLQSSDEIVLTRSFLGTGAQPSSGRDLRNYEIYCSETEFDNPIVARFYLKHL